MSAHGGRAHSKFSASGSERWFNCPGSVELSEGQPDKSSPWALEGTLAHEVLEKILLARIKNPRADAAILVKDMAGVNRAMIGHGEHAASFMRGLWKDHRKKDASAEILVETRIYLDFIHPEMFGTFDGAVVDHFGTLHVFDYKYGAGHAVSPVDNLQMIFYAIGLAHKYHWNFKKVVLWIIQPRIKGYDGPLFWEVPTLDLKARVDDFKRAVERVENNPTKYAEGGWCHWCKAKSVCPLKTEKRTEKAKSIFLNAPLPGLEVNFGKENYNGKEKSSEKESSKEGEDFY